jgi:hypothetical protein
MSPEEGSENSGILASSDKFQTIETLTLKITVPGGRLGFVYPLFIYFIFIIFQMYYKNFSDKLEIKQNKKICTVIAKNMKAIHVM